MIVAAESIAHAAEFTPCAWRQRGGIELAAPVRYTGDASGGRGVRATAPRTLTSSTAQENCLKSWAYGMSAATFDTVAKIISETCDIPRDKIKPESHAINDLGIDSLDFLDIAFAIDKTFGIKMPLEQWTQEVNEGRATTEQYFVLQNLSTRIDELVAAKKA
jgi:acyl carrier protein